MSSKNDYQDFLKQQKAMQEKPLAHVFLHQEQRYVKPFQIYGNVYYVGDSWVCVHLIDTGDGLLLIDAGNTGAAHLLVQAIWEAGFRPQDVKWIILSHGHVDHIGAACFFRDMFGTKLYMGEPDARMFEEQPELSFIQDGPCLDSTVFAPDVSIQDGDVLQFGNTKIQCYLVPGHTAGCVALFFDAHKGSETLRCGYYGGFGFNTLSREALAEANDPECRMWTTYAQSIDKVLDQPVDIFLGNHTENNRTLEKRALVETNRGNSAAGNPFIDRAEWKAYLLQKKAELERFIQAESQK